MKNSIYVDGITNIVMVEGVIRFDLVTLDKTAQATPKDVAPQFDVITSVATTLPGFLRIHEQIQGVINNMLEQGLLNKNAVDTQLSDLPAV
ncbi:MAG: hypothetical protein WCK81_15085 [Betaproteobacteria bacterium]